MRSRFIYVEGYGWHAGRLLVWPALLVGCLVGIFPVIMFDAVMAGVTGRDWPWGAILPGLHATWLWRRIRRKLRGEPFVWQPVSLEDMPDPHVDLIHRHHDERRWNSLLRMELLAWGGTLVIHLVLLSFWWSSTGSR